MLPFAMSMFHLCIMYCWEWEYVDGGCSAVEDERELIRRKYARENLNLVVRIYYEVQEENDGSGLGKTEENVSGL